MATRRTIRLARGVAGQIQQADARWREHRSPRELLNDEVNRVLRLLPELPRIGARDTRWPHVRRFYLRKVQHFIYYRVAEDTVDILAFQHDARGGAPVVR